MCRRRTNYARSGLQPFCQKVTLFDSDNPAGSCPRSVGSACPKASQSFAARSGERKSNHFLRRHVRRRKYRSACKRAHRPPWADGACAAAGRKPFRQKSTTFLTKATPQAIACGVVSAWPRFIASEAGLAPSGSPAAPAHNLAAADVPKTTTTPAGRVCRAAAACPKASQSFAAAAAKESPIIFSGDMRGGENTSQAASVEFVCPRRTNYARSRLQPLCQKGILFDSDNPAGQSLRGCLRVSAVDCIRGGPCPLGLPCGSVT